MPTQYVHPALSTIRRDALCEAYLPLRGSFPSLQDDLLEEDRRHNVTINGIKSSEKYVATSARHLASGAGLVGGIPVGVHEASCNISNLIKKIYGREYT